MSAHAAAPPRTMVAWIPDWPILAHRQSLGLTGDAPAALVAGRRIVAASAAARAEGVRAGLREREAQQRCPGIELHPYDPEIDTRLFEPVLAAIEETVPAVEPIRPGLCAIRARGPARYYGSEAAAGVALLAVLRERGLTEARIGIADGRFAAEQAARGEPIPRGDSPADSFSGDSPASTDTDPALRLVPAGSAPAFLAPLPVARATGAELSDVLHGLGIRTLGALAALPAAVVAERFGPAGAAAHRLASATDGEGRAAEEVRPRSRARDLEVSLDAEPPITLVDQLAFTSSTQAERFVRQLAEERLVCTELTIVLVDDTGAVHERSWAHPRQFTASDVVNRIRWQATALYSALERGGAGIAQVRLSPQRTDRAERHEPGLWNTGPDERIHHHLTRLQTLLGHEEVVSPRIAGGREAPARQRLVPWGTKETGAAPKRPRASAASGPWPGHLPAPYPSIVLGERELVELLGADGQSITIDDEDLLAATPGWFRASPHERPTAVQAWSAPWPLRQHWWDESEAPDGELHRMQVVLADGNAWLLAHTEKGWFAEGKYH